jgi:2-oxoglutarate ferredoxin oxidoreductase subunit delta
MNHIAINEAWCKGCNLCIIFCPVQALHEAEHLNRRGIHPPQMIPNHRCNGCRLCELVCPDFAVTVTTAADAAAQPAQ